MLSPSIVYTSPASLLHRPAFVEMEDKESIPLALGKRPCSPTLIQFSEDVQLAWTRRMLIERAGFSVRTCTPWETHWLNGELEAIPVVALFCHTVAANEAASLTQRLKQRFRTILVIRLTSTWEPRLDMYDKILHAPISPEDFLGELIRLRASLGRSSTLAL